MGQNTALKTRRLKKMGQPQKKKGGEKIRLKAQRKISTKSCTKHQKGRKYI